MRKKILKSLIYLSGGAAIVALILAVNYFTMAWTEPTSAPPAGSGSLASGKWSDGATAGDIYYNSGNVGIGTNNPGQTLDVNGNVNVRGSQVRMSNSNTHFYGDSTNAAVRMDGEFYVQNSAGTGYKNVGANDYYINTIGRWASSLGNSNICYCIQCRNTAGTWNSAKCASFGNWTSVSGAPLTGIDDVSYCRMRLYPCT